MKLTDSEKLILIMLCDIHEALKLKNSVDPKFIREAIYSDNTWGLDWKYSGIFGSSETPQVVVNEVVDILDMWSFLEHGYDKLSQADKDQVEADAIPFGKTVRFLGFDGNNETEHMSVARFLIEQLGRFDSFKNRGDLNAHMPSLNTYQRMLSVFKPLRTGLADRSLSANEIIEILKARLHPSNR